MKKQKIVYSYFLTTTLYYGGSHGKRHGLSCSRDISLEGIGEANSYVEGDGDSLVSVQRRQKECLYNAEFI
ncbi:hypothetical protein [Brevibacillus sp. IT-7CA2]|uniref:hypothetical protein n=1 Tax=Brevibacillus sp. IT-7CA2 TaxID=3026436 RepID=UPI0039DFAC9F